MLTCGSPAFIILKKEQAERHLVADYRALDKITVQNRYPFSKIDDISDQLKGVMYLTKVDPASGYH